MAVFTRGMHAVDEVQVEERFEGKVAGEAEVSSRAADVSFAEMPSGEHEVGGEDEEQSNGIDGEDQDVDEAQAAVVCFFQRCDPRADH